MGLLLVCLFLGGQRGGAYVPDAWLIIASWGKVVERGQEREARGEVFFFFPSLLPPNFLSA